MKKRKRIVIKTPYHTMEQTRKAMKISKKRAKEIIEMMDEIFDLENKRRKSKRRKNKII